MTKPKPKLNPIKPITSIEFDRARYEALVRALQIAGAVYALLGDMADEGTAGASAAAAAAAGDFKKYSDAIDDLESWVLASAAEFGMAPLVEIFEGKNVLRDEAMDRYTDDLIEYEELTFWDVFAHKLTDRELARRKASGQLAKMTEQQIVDLHIELEEKFNEEFDKHGIARVEIKE